MGLYSLNKHQNFQYDLLSALFAVTDSCSELDPVSSVGGVGLSTLPKFSFDVGFVYAKPTPIPIFIITIPHPKRFCN